MPDHVAGFARPNGLFAGIRIHSLVSGIVEKHNQLVGRADGARPGLAWLVVHFENAHPRVFEFHIPSHVRAPGEIGARDGRQQQSLFHTAVSYHNPA